MSRAECRCPNCGRGFSAYDAGQVFCCIGCAFDQDPERCEHGYSTEYCVRCHSETWLGGTSGAWCREMCTAGSGVGVAHESPRGSSAP